MGVKGQGEFIHTRSCLVEGAWTCCSHIQLPLLLPTKNIKYIGKQNESVHR